MAPTEHRADLVVIGAGINGAGIARDAALRGLRVVLVDKGDAGGGTTAASTRLVHGGRRYLGHFELRLVYESLRERERLLRIAAHLVRPLAFLIPIYEGGTRTRALVRMGMLAYDALSMQKSLEHHHMLDAAETLAHEPGLKPEGLRGAALYHDAQAEYPERLTVENVLSAQALGTTVLTHTRVTGLVRAGAAVVGVELRDELDGTEGRALAPVVVNA